MFNENWYLVKKLVLSSIRKKGYFPIKLVGKKYNVLYEGSQHRGERDYEIIKFLASKKKCILDIGANVGLSTLLLAEDNQADIHAFEASEYAAKLTIQHAFINGIGDRVKVVNALVSDEAGTTVPFYWDFNSGGASIFKGRLGHNFPIIKSTITIDDYVYQQKLSPDLLKVDVEGAELMVIKGSVKTLEKTRPLVLLELHELGNVPLHNNAEQILALLSPLNYQMIYLKTKSVVSDTEVLKGRGRCHVLLCDLNFPFQKVFQKIETSFL